MPPFPIQIPSPPPLFPTYFLPSNPFRRRSSASTTSVASTPSSSLSDEVPSDSYLSGNASHLRCARCLSDLAPTTQIISKGFTGRHGRAYLVSPTPSSLPASTAPNLTLKQKNAALPNLPNTHAHRPVSRQLVTGAHTVGDVSCAQCGSVLGWKYVGAEEEGQRYKVGKVILETRRVVKGVCWEGEEGGEVGSRKGSLKMPPETLEEVEFDSQDEDECEDLFMGVWTPELARKRRGKGI